MPGAREGGLRRKRALADALSGVAGSLVSLWTFYPIEVLKTNLQAGSFDKEKSLFQGCQAKTIYTASSNFCYFFLYSWIFSNWQRRNPKTKINPSTRLILSAVAAILNTLITLPLDVISSRQLTQKEETIDSEIEGRTNMEQVWEDLKEDPSTDSEFQECLSDFDEGKKAKHSRDSEAEKRPNSSSVETLEVSESEESWSSLWKGLTPALLLCSNPSINYTVFDMTKNRVLKRDDRAGTSLSMPEAFLLGLFAKFVATIATYPLIRAKVILMVTSEKSLLASLIRSYREEGARGLYKGCDWQLFHTMLKSALMMMVREKIAFSTQRLIVGDAPKR